MSELADTQVRLDETIAALHLAEARALRTAAELAQAIQRGDQWRAEANEHNAARLKAEAEVERLRRSPGPIWQYQEAERAAWQMRAEKTEEALREIERMCRLWGSSHARIAQVARSVLPKDEDAK